jgi:RNA polymerase sigma-70 factor, ECF subfamily
VREQQVRFEELVLPHLDAAYRLARLLVKHDEDAKDIVQEAYVKALKGFERFRGGNARAWILMIVRNTAYSWLKKHEADSNLVPFDEAVHQLPTEESAFESVYEERSHQLREALARLPVDFREILVLRDIEGWSYKELASALKLRLGTVMSRLNRARLRLREEIAKVQSRESSR